MIHRKHGLQAFGLGLFAMLGLLAFNAVAAQAGGEWEIETSAGVTKLLSELSPTLESIGGNFEKGGGIFNGFLIPGLGLQISCLTADVESGSHITSESTGLLNVLLLECVVVGAEHHCEVLNILLEAKIKLILHADNDIYALLLPVTGQPLFKIVIHHRLPAEPVCNVTTPLPLATGLAITGSLVLKLSQTLAVTQLVVTAPAALFPADKMKYGNQNMTFDLTAELFLNGLAHGNKKWGVEHIDLC